ncbi:hypothetical protein evm_008812 [Chilo suppressalis]|nr:hypothetical protein evm_008812 [Chilo suppressalis]
MWEDQRGRSSSELGDGSSGAAARLMLVGHRIYEELASEFHLRDVGIHTIMIAVQELDCSIQNTSKSATLPLANKDSAFSKKLEIPKESYACHLCCFDADRITVLDRHLLNHHKIGLENLLKLVMAKTKDGLSEENQNADIYGIRQPYYRPPDDIVEEGEFLIETVTPRIKILKHAATNTDIQWTDIPDLKDNCRKITKELEKLVKYPSDKIDKGDLMAKMQTLSECMCKYVDSTNTLRSVLTKEFDSKTSVRERMSAAEPFFDLDLRSDTPREWEKANSEKMERSRHKYGDGCRYSTHLLFIDSVSKYREKKAALAEFLVGSSQYKVSRRRFANRWRSFLTFTRDSCRKTVEQEKFRKNRRSPVKSGDLATLMLLLHASFKGSQVVRGREHVSGQSIFGHSIMFYAIFIVAARYDGRFDISQ